MMVLSLIGVGALVSGVSGIKFINDAYASHNHNVSAPGLHDIFNRINTYSNTSSVTLTIAADGSSCNLDCISP